MNSTKERFISKCLEFLSTVEEKNESFTEEVNSQIRIRLTNLLKKKNFPALLNEFREESPKCVKFFREKVENSSSDESPDRRATYGTLKRDALIVDNLIRSEMEEILEELSPGNITRLRRRMADCLAVLGKPRRRIEHLYRRYGGGEIPKDGPEDPILTKSFQRHPQSKPRPKKSKRQEQNRSQRRTDSERIRRSDIFRALGKTD